MKLNIGIFFGLLMAAVCVTSNARAIETRVLHQSAKSTLVIQASSSEEPKWAIEPTEDVPMNLSLPVTVVGPLRSVVNSQTKQITCQPRGDSSTRNYGGGNFRVTESAEDLKANQCALIFDDRYHQQRDLLVNDNSYTLDFSQHKGGGRLMYMGSFGYYEWNVHDANGAYVGVYRCEHDMINNHAKGYINGQLRNCFILQ